MHWKSDTQMQWRNRKIFIANTFIENFKRNTPCPSVHCNTFFIDSSFWCVKYFPKYTYIPISIFNLICIAIVVHYINVNIKFYLFDIWMQLKEKRNGIWHCMCFFLTQKKVKPLKGIRFFFRNSIANNTV